MLIVEFNEATVLTYFGSQRKCRPSTLQRRLVWHLSFYKLSQRALRTDHIDSGDAGDWEYSIDVNPVCVPDKKKKVLSQVYIIMYGKPG